MQITKIREHATDLLNRLAAGQLAAVIHLLEVMTDPVARAVISTPLDNELVTEEDRRRFAKDRNGLRNRAVAVLRWQKCWLNLDGSRKTSPPVGNADLSNCLA